MLRLLKASSIAPSARISTLPGWPEPSVIRRMPLVKASITTIRPTTSVKARPVMSVVRQRSVRLRKV